MTVNDENEFALAHFRALTPPAKRREPITIVYHPSWGYDLRIPTKCVRVRGKRAVKKFESIFSGACADYIRAKAVVVIDPHSVAYPFLTEYFA